jgi:hypothetical protein
MKNFHIKKISQINQEKLKQFYLYSFKFEKNIHDNYTWRYRLGFNDFEPLALIIDNKICGHAGLMPVNLKINNKIEKSIWFTDFFIEEKYRSLGYGKLLTEAWMKICPLQITLCNEHSLKIFKKLNWSFNNSFVRKIKIINYLNILPIFRKSNSSPFKINEEVKSLKIENIDNATISKIADLNEKKLSTQKSGLVRDENWFKWRIIDCPYKKDIFILKYNNIYLIIHKLKKNNLNVLNVIYSSEKINPDLIRALSIFSKSNNVDYLAFVEKKSSLIEGILPENRKINFAFYSKNPSDISQIDKYLNDIQYIDSDLDFI